MNRLRNSLPGALLILTLALLAAPAADPAHAAVGPCLADGGGPTCHLAYGKATFVADGDTIDVNIAGDGTSRPRRIRLTGINAMELRRYSKYPERRRGACHARAATARLEQLLRAGHRRVRLAAQHVNSHAGHRLRRQVSVKLSGAWVDTGQVLLREGHALWLPNGHERAWNGLYRVLSQQAAAERLRLWNPLACGGPARNASLSLHVRWDAKGNDRRRPNGEWLRVRNLSPFAVSLRGWWVRDSALRRYRFPAGASIGPHRSVLVHVGHGRRHGRHFYWGLDGPAFENSGDGGYLFARRGGLRAYDIYPR
jgi:micrococcal nuclease